MTIVKDIYVPTNKFADVIEMHAYLSDSLKTADGKYINGLGFITDNYLDELYAVKVNNQQTHTSQFRQITVSISSANNSLTQEKLLEVGTEMAELIHEKGHQVIVYVHDDTDYPHLHFLVNTVNFISGNIIKQTKKELNRLKVHCNHVLVKNNLDSIKMSHDEMLDSSPHFLCDGFDAFEIFDKVLKDTDAVFEEICDKSLSDSLTPNYMHENTSSQNDSPECSALISEYSESNNNSITQEETRMYNYSDIQDLYGNFNTSTIDQLTNQFAGISTYGNNWYGTSIGTNYPTPQVSYPNPNYYSGFSSNGSNWYPNNGRTPYQTPTAGSPNPNYYSGFSSNGSNWYPNHGRTPYQTPTAGSPNPNYYSGFSSNGGNWYPNNGRPNYPTPQVSYPNMNYYSGTSPNGGNYYQNPTQSNYPVPQTGYTQNKQFLPFNQGGNSMYNNSNVPLPAGIDSTQYPNSLQYNPGLILDSSKNVTFTQSSNYDASQLAGLINNIEPIPEAQRKRDIQMGIASMAQLQHMGYDVPVYVNNSTNININFDDSRNTEYIDVPYAE